MPAVLVLATTEAPRVFTGDELSLLQALAAEAALALDRGQLGRRAGRCARAGAARCVDRQEGAVRARPRRRAQGRRRGDRLRDRRQPLLPQARRTGRADADRRRVGRSGVRSDRSRRRPSRGLEPRRARPQDRGRRRHPRGVGAHRSDARRDGGPARARQPRRPRDAGPRVREDDRDLRAPPLGARRVVGRGDRARRGRRARTGDCDPRRAAAPRERAAPRTTDRAPQGGPGRDERAPARDRPPAARGRGDEAARCGRGRLLPLRLGQFAPPLRGRPRARSEARRLRVPGRALGRRAIQPSPCRTPPTRGSRARSRRR